MQDKQLAKYNGWSNRETWLASLWLNDNPSSQALLNEAIERDESDFAKAEWLVSQLEDEMYDLHIEASLWSDLIGTGLSRINWVEVIENN